MANALFLLVIVVASCRQLVVAKNIPEDIANEIWNNFKVWPVFHNPFYFQKSMKFVRVVRVCLCVSATTKNDDENDRNWLNFHFANIFVAQLEYGKSYTELENDYRASIFMNNWKRVIQHNHEYAMNRSTYRMDINKYADLTLKEQLLLRRGLIIPNDYDKNDTTPSPVTYIGANGVRLPKSINWTDLGAVTEVKDQGKFNSASLFDSHPLQLHFNFHSIAPLQAYVDHAGHFRRPAPWRANISVPQISWFHCLNKILLIAHDDMVTRDAMAAGWTGHSFM